MSFMYHSARRVRRSRLRTRATLNKATRATGASQSFGLNGTWVQGMTNARGGAYISAKWPAPESSFTNLRKQIVLMLKPEGQWSVAIIKGT